VSSFEAKEGGKNAILNTKDKVLEVDSPLFSASATVEESTGDKEVANWDVGFIQTAASHFVEANYKETILRVNAATPARDAVEGTNEPWYRTDSNTPAQAGGKATVSMDDHPGISPPWKDPRTGERDALVGVTRRFGLRAWLIARNRVSAAIVYLKNISWGLDFGVKVDSAKRKADNTGPGMVAATSGDGRGSANPTLNGTVYNALVKDKGNIELKPRGAASSASRAARSSAAPAVQLNASEPPRNK
jgi:hypothetical protein